jgi:hypothetical protein
MVFLLFALLILIIDSIFLLYGLEIIEKSDVLDIDFLLRILSIIEVLLFDLRNSSSGSY